MIATEWKLWLGSDNKRMSPHILFLMLQLASLFLGLSLVCIDLEKCCAFACNTP